jgi:ParB-like chromosome segregation protein Spo0J
MTPEELKEMTDGGVDLSEIPGLEIKKVDPETIAVDKMNERRDQPLDLEKLERSVAKNGIVQPPVCRVLNEDAKVKYGVIQGQRRVLAAQNMQLDSIDILVGDIEDRTALVRSITENFAGSNLDVPTIPRAEALWQLWKIIDGPDYRDLPSPAKLSEELGVNAKTVSNWLAPLRKSLKGTSFDVRDNNQIDERGAQMSEELKDVNPDILKRITTLTSGDEAEELVKQAIDYEMTQKDVRDLTKQPSASENPFQALEEVKQAKQAAEAARGFTLQRMRFGDNTGAALRQAARATGKDKKVVVKDAVGYYLREEGYL